MERRVSVLIRGEDTSIHDAMFSDLHNVSLESKVMRQHGINGELEMS